MKIDEDTCPTEFWDTLYRRQSAQSNGQVSLRLASFVQHRKPGKALDLGCARGDDSIWLAHQGWDVTAVDVSAVALDYARLNAQKNAPANAPKFLQADLAEEFPAGRYELISAIYLQTPLHFPRKHVFKTAANAVIAGGLLLIVDHGSYAPWQWGDPNHPPPPAVEKLASLALDENHWRPVFVGEKKRTAHGPGGQEAEILDSIIALERRA